MTTLFTGHRLIVGLDTVEKILALTVVMSISGGFLTWFALDLIEKIS